MPAPRRRRVDFTRLPVLARYGLALAVLAVVVAVALIVRSGHHSGAPATWYTVVVRVGAVLLLVYLVGWLVWRLVVRRRRD